MISPTPSRRSPIKFRHSHRLGAVALVAVSAVLAGCSPAPSPTPTPTAAFASEKEAFAAAEETYRAFTARLNQLDIADPATFEPLFALSSGEFEAADRKSYSAMHAEGFVIEGDTKVLSFQGVEAASPFDKVSAKVCLDVSAVTVTDSAGISQIDANRPNVYSLDVVFVADQSSLTIDSVSVNKEAKCATP
ncbi:hypothetical protein ACIQTX_13640 [Microbacterium sp. NPDC090281]|uniref:hypothetical protein n=1 Tax=Microbacterium sp. NPDC090281 TaxID=3364208 RepID=UPI003804E8BD